MTCENCGRVYDEKDGTNNQFHDFCSEKCEVEYDRLQKITRDYTTKKWLKETEPACKTKPTATCSVCGKIVNGETGYRYIDLFFCSTTCRDKYFEKNFHTNVDKSDNVSHPSRYNQGGIEFWDVEKAFFGIDSHVDHLVQSAMEYCVRFRRKNGAEDLRKAANLLTTASNLMEGDSK